MDREVEIVQQPTEIWTPDGSFVDVPRTGERERLKSFVPLDHGPGMLTLRPYQQDAVDSVFRELQTHVSTLLVLATGCVSGDTEICLRVMGNYRYMRISKAYELFKNRSAEVRQLWPIEVMSLLRDGVGPNPVREILFSGHKETYELQLEGPMRELRATPDHEMLTENGFVALGNLSGNDRVVRTMDGESVVPARIKSIKPFEIEPTYDIVCEDPYRNFVANGVVVHNCGKTVCAAEIAYRWPFGRVLFMAHREELIDQGAASIGYHIDEACSIEMGERKESRHGHGLLDRSKVLVTSVQTMSRENRLKWFSPLDFGLIIVDECVTGDTVVACIDGDRTIAEIYDTNRPIQVVSYNAEKACTEPRWVVGRKRSVVERVCVITFTGGHCLKCTPEHLVMTGRGYVPASELRGWMAVEASNGIVDVVSVTFECEPTTVYDIGVEGNHNYFANGILVHNCHHAPSQSYRRVLEHFHQNAQLRHIGLTATPVRHDKKAMGDIYKSVAYEMDIRRGIDAGYLVNVKPRFVVIEGLDFTAVRTTAGDLNQGDLAQVMMKGHVGPSVNMSDDMSTEDQEIQERMLHAVVSATIQESAGRSTLVFAVTKKHAESLCEVFNRHPGVTAEFVTDETSKDMRRDIVQRFRNGVTQVLTGVGVFTEGFDCPLVEVIAVARPTKSKSLYCQMVGRGTRPLPGIVDRYDTAEERREAIANSKKSSVTILDFVGCSGKHDLLSAVDILGGDYEEDILEAARRRLRESGEALNIDDLLKEEQKHSVERKEKAMQLAKQKRDREEARRQSALADAEARKRAWNERNRTRGHALYHTEEVSPWEPASVPEQVGVAVQRGGATDNQIGFLKRLGVSADKASQMTKAQAGAVIDKLSNQHGGDYILRYGKYQGRMLRDVPKQWIDWAQEKLNDQKLLNEIDAFLGK